MKKIIFFVFLMIFIVASCSEDKELINTYQNISLDENITIENVNIEEINKTENISELLEENSTKIIENIDYRKTLFVIKNQTWGIAINLTGFNDVTLVDDNYLYDSDNDEYYNYNDSIGVSIFAMQLKNESKVVRPDYVCRDIGEYILIHDLDSTDFKKEDKFTFSFYAEDYKFLVYTPYYNNNFCLIFSISTSKDYNYAQRAYKIMRSIGYIDNASVFDGPIINISLLGAGQLTSSRNVTTIKNLEIPLQS